MANSEVRHISRIEPEDDHSRLSQFELNQIMSGRATPDEIYRGHDAAKRKAEQQTREYESQQNNPNLFAMGERVAELEAANELLNRRLAAIETQMAMSPVLEGGRLPPKADITQLWCQVFHTTNLTAKQKKTKTEWSLRLTVWVNNKRVKREINVRLFPCDQFYRQVMHRNTLPKLTDEWATALQDYPTVLGGMLTAVTQGGGRPYIPSQFCVLSGHMSDDPEVDLIIDDDVIAFENLRLSAGTSKWFLDWHP
jgi:hypothetical protein